MKKILISAFCCAPNKGSDAEIGWQWGIGLEKGGYDVWVITRTFYKDAIEKEIQRNHSCCRIHFIYYDMPLLLKVTSKIKIRNYFYYYLWQWGAYKFSKKKHDEQHFDIVHHVSWVSIRQPSFMGKLGIPFIFGPVAGGEKAPSALRNGYALRQKVVDKLRDIVNGMIKLDPLMLSTFKRASVIYATSKETQALIPSQYRGKSQVKLAIALNNVLQKKMRPRSISENKKDTEFKILYVGRFLGWKGMHLGLAALKKMIEVTPNARLTMVGKGPEEHNWKNLAHQLNIENHIDWIPWVEQSKLSDFYHTADIFLFPSLHDSGGLVVLEAMMNGLPVICLDIGGPGVIVNQKCGFSIDIHHKTQSDVIHQLAQQMVLLSQDPNLKRQLSYGAVSRANEFQWKHLVKSVYKNWENP